MTLNSSILFDEVARGTASPAQTGLASGGGANQQGFHSPGELDVKHRELLELQGQRCDSAELVDKARDFVAGGRSVGAKLEDPRIRQHCQSILDYWALLVYRSSQVEIETDLLPFDPSLADFLAEDDFPYRFEDYASSRAQQMRGWRRLLDECERDLAGDHLLAVFGDMGAGSRFLVHQLLLPTLRAGRARLPELAGSDQWRYYEVPLGETPVRDLLRAIALHDGHDSSWVAEHEKEFRSDAGTLARILETARNGRRCWSSNASLRCWRLPTVSAPRSSRT
jgi:hypothetical protein